MGPRKEPLNRHNGHDRVHKGICVHTLKASAAAALSKLPKPAQICDGVRPANSLRSQEFWYQGCINKDLSNCRHDNSVRGNLGRLGPSPNAACSSTVF